jgi:hypothetical protein
MENAESVKKLFILPQDLSGLSTILFLLSFKVHKSLEYCCLETETFTLIGEYFFLFGCIKPEIKRSKQSVLSR